MRLTLAGGQRKCKIPREWRAALPLDCGTTTAALALGVKATGLLRNLK